MTNIATAHTDQTIRAMVNKAIDKQRGAPVGVYLTASYSGVKNGFEFVMVGPDVQIHKLLASQTSQERLDAHWEGFVATFSRPEVNSLEVSAFSPSFPNPAIWTDALTAKRQAEYAAFLKTPDGLAEQRAFDNAFSEIESRRELERFTQRCFEGSTGEAHA